MRLWCAFLAPPASFLFTVFAVWQALGEADAGDKSVTRFLARADSAMATTAALNGMGALAASVPLLVITCIVEFVLLVRRQNRGLTDRDLRESRQVWDEPWRTQEAAWTYEQDENDQPEEQMGALRQAVNDAVQNDVVGR